MTANTLALGKFFGHGAVDVIPSNTATGAEIVPTLIPVYTVYVQWDNPCTHTMELDVGKKIVDYS